MKRSSILMAAMLFTGLALSTIATVKASDHDDGEMDLKGRSLNLTDLYVFREDWQDSSANPNNLVLIMSTNPRSLARQQYSFSTQGRYEFHVSRVKTADKAKKPTGADDVTLRFEFGQADANGRQPITLTTIRDGKEDKISVGTTSLLGDAPIVNSGSIDGHNLSVFAGLREDSFFFDVESYFRLRGYLAGIGPAPVGGLFRTAAKAVDFTAGYNVNSIVLRVPINFLQTSAGEPSFDVWETISVPK
jgi:hypothetical protein